MNTRETATVLAALRCLQLNTTDLTRNSDFPDHFELGDIEALTDDEIDELCEQIAMNEPRHCDDEDEEECE